jgi:predicted phosphoadenosine phosphosulfate sulfurtransferase
MKIFFSGLLRIASGQKIPQKVVSRFLMWFSFTGGFYFTTMIFHLRNNKKPNNEIECFIYCIKHPITSQIMYIGYTSNPISRKNYHLNVGWEKNKKAAWIRQMKEQGMMPEFEIIKTISNRISAKAEERKLIKMLNPILNTEK